MKLCWEVLIQELYNLNALGELYIRMPNMETIYRSMDVVLTPHRIVTRVIGEALSCGIPIITSNGCKVSQFHCDPHNPYSVSKAITEFINSDQIQNKKNALEESKKFNYDIYLENVPVLKNNNIIWIDILKISYSRQLFNNIINCCTSFSDKTDIILLLEFLSRLFL